MTDKQQEEEVNVCVINLYIILTAPKKGQNLELNYSKGDLGEVKRKRFDGGKKQLIMDTKQITQLLLLLVVGFCFLKFKAECH